MILFYYKILYSPHYYSSFRLYFTVILEVKGNFSLLFDGKLHIYSNLEGIFNYNLTLSSINYLLIFKIKCSFVPPLHFMEFSDKIRLSN